MINTYYKSQKELVRQLIIYMDSYWNMEVSETIFIEVICTIVEKNSHIMYKNEQLTSIVKQRLGKKRIRLLEDVLKEKEVTIYEKQ